MSLVDPHGTVPEMTRLWRAVAAGRERGILTLQQHEAFCKDKGQYPGVYPQLGPPGSTAAGSPFSHELNWPWEPRLLGLHGRHHGIHPMALWKELYNRSMFAIISHPPFFSNFSPLCYKG